MVAGNAAPDAAIGVGRFGHSARFDHTTRPGPVADALLQGFEVIEALQCRRIGLVNRGAGLI
ncbi:hypothetical protein D9M68_932270 [compost metagenome]